ncbi:MAG: Three-deoxy-D-manno-octulosonic-acid transferase domain protein [Verrucomicrobia bacterium]|nr:Three-deoxy-D-manno-octulosonic-acid transferase domain protein [Verrucomicrobiota bacterium]
MFWAFWTTKRVTLPGPRIVIPKLTKSRHSNDGLCPLLMLWLYRILFLPGLLVAAPAYAWRMRRRGGYRENFHHRFGAHDGLPAKRPGVRRIWLQAVSVGEMLAIAPLIEALVKTDGVEIYLTTTTSTGYALAVERYRELTVGIGYFPLDSWIFSQRAWRRIEPDLVILTEGERWPEHIHQAAKRRVPVVCINARLSDRSFRRMQAFGPASRLMLEGITRLLPCSAQDAARFAELGFPAERMTTTGNIKLDVAIPLLDWARREKLREELGLPAGLVLMGSSTWPGEESALVEALREARAAGLQVSLLVVPRHAERRGELERSLQETGLRFHFRSKGNAPGEVDVAVADTTGELRSLLQLADVVFVGKSLPPHTEGQTPVEAAALEKPILFGPGMGNFRLIARDLLARRAAIGVADPAELATVAVELLRDEARRNELAAAAGQWRRDNAGALGRTLEAIREELLALNRSEGS